MNIECDSGYYKPLTKNCRIHIEILVRESARTVGTFGKEGIELFNNEFLRLATEYAEGYYGINLSHDVPEET